MKTLFLNALTSKTIIGLVLAAIGQTTFGSDIIATFGVTDETAPLFVDQIITFVGLLLGVYGRAVAKGPLTK